MRIRKLTAFLLILLLAAGCAPAAFSAPQREAQAMAFDPDEGLQESARVCSEGLDFSRPEDVMEYAWRLSESFPDCGAPQRLIGYSNDIWELRWDNSPVAWNKSPVTVFFSALDGHIIYVERRGE